MWNQLKRLFSPRQRRAQAQWRALVKLCLGDTERAERLLQRELDRSPGISHAEACRRAIVGYQRDNR